MSQPSLKSWQPFFFLFSVMSKQTLKRQKKRKNPRASGNELCIPWQREAQKIFLAAAICRNCITNRTETEQLRRPSTYTASSLYKFKGHTVRSTIEKFECTEIKRLEYFIFQRLQRAERQNCVNQKYWSQKKKKSSLNIMDLAEGPVL